LSHVCAENFDIKYNVIARVVQDGKEDSCGQTDASGTPVDYCRICGGLRAVAAACDKRPSCKSFDMEAMGNCGYRKTAGGKHHLYLFLFFSSSSSSSLHRLTAFMAQYWLSAVEASEPPRPAASLLHSLQTSTPNMFKGRPCMLQQWLFKLNPDQRDQPEALLYACKQLPRLLP
jgi:hypothetical protein